MKARSTNNTNPEHTCMTGQGLPAKVGESIATCFLSALYIGYLPFMPGTFGSAFASILLYVFPLFFGCLPATVCLIVLLSVVAVVCFNASKHAGSDPGWVVIDEVIGSFVAVAGHRMTFVTIVGGFVLFRIFDILKPFPVNRAERLPGGYGVVADDIVAGVYASIILFVWEFAMG